MMFNYFGKKKWVAVVMVAIMLFTLLPSDFSWADAAVGVNTEDSVTDTIKETTTEENQAVVEQTTEMVTSAEQTEDVGILEQNLNTTANSFEADTNLLEDTNLLGENVKSILDGTGIDIASIILSKVDKDGMVTVKNGDTIKTSDTLDYSLTFSIGSSFNIEDGVSYTYQLPTGINIKKSFSVPLTNQANGSNLGTAYIDSETGLITFVFDTAQMKPNTNFGLKFGGGLSSSSSETVSSETISFPTASGKWDYNLNIEKDGDSSEDKEPGEISVYKYGTQVTDYTTPAGTKVSAIRWEVSVNPNGRSPFNATVKDVLPDGLTYIEGSAQITDEQYGNTPGLGVSQNGQEIRFDIDNSKPNSGYTKLVFYTSYDGTVYGNPINSSSSKVIDNTVIVTPDGETDTGAKGSVTLKPNVLTKTGSTDAANGCVNWTVTINAERLNIGGTTYNDILGTGISGLTQAEMDALKTQIESQLPAGVTCTVDENGFKFTFPAGYQDKLVLTYQTPIKDYTVSQFTNEGKLTGSSFDISTTGKADGVDLITKNGVGYTPIGQLFTWKVIVNRAKLTLGDNVYITEDMLPTTAGSSTYTPELVSITDSEGNTLTPDAAGHYNLGNIDGKTVELTVITKIPDGTTINQGWYNQKNQVDLTWENKTTSANAEINYEYKNPDIAEKSGKLDSKNGKIDWQIKIKGQDGLSQDKLTIEDTLPAGTVLVEGSVILKADWGYSDVTLNASDYTFDKATRKLTISLSKSDSRFEGILGITGQYRSYTISYSTKLDTENDDSLNNSNKDISYTNSAQITAKFPGNVEVTETETATVTGKINGLLGKEYTYQSGKQTVDWIVSVNEAGYDLSKISNPRIVDTLPSYFDYVKGTGALYKTDGSKVPESDYKISFINRVLMVNLPTNGGTAGYTFKFTTRFNCYDSQLPSNVTNSVSFLGLGEDVSVTSDKVDNISFSYASGWSETNASIKVRKIDSQTKAGLQNATMTLKLGEQILDTKVSDADGWVEFPVTYDSNTTLTVDIYEDQAPEGYKKTTAPITITLDDNTQWKTDPDNPDLQYIEIEFPNDKIVKSATFYMKKFNVEDATKIVSGAVYGIYSESQCTNEIGTMTTDENGEAHYSVDCPSTGSDTYYIKEKTSPAGYKISTDIYKVNVNDDTTVSYQKSDGTDADTVQTTDAKTAMKVTDEKAKGTLTLKKVDKNDTTILSGAKFGVYLDSACTNLVGEITTDASGSGSLSGLELGKTYYYRELQAPDNYILDSTVYSVVVGLSTATIDQLVTQTVTNEKQVGIIKITKTDDNASRTALKGVTFQLQKDDGTGNYVNVTDSDGNTVTATTNEVGIAQFTGLTFGKYKVIETVGPGEKYDYHTESTDGILVTVDTTSAKEVSVVNKIIHFNVKLTKVDESNTPLNGVVFGLYDSLGALKRTGSTDENGNLTFSDIEYGDYYVKEVAGLSGYKINNKKYNITEADIKAKYVANGYATPTITIGDNPATTITNKKENGKIAFYKYGVDTDGTENPLQGAVFTLYDRNGFVVATGTSDTTGLVTFDNLAYGTYTIRETTVPGGYNSDGNLYQVTVEKDGTDGFYTIAGNNQKNTTITGTWNAGTTISETTAGKIYNQKIPENKVNYLSFYVTKTYKDINQQEKPLPGAVFAFSKSTDNGVTWKDAVTVTSDTDGKVEIHNYVVENDPNDTQYKIEEISAPAGYKIPTDGSAVKIYKKADIATNDYGHANYVADFENSAFTVKELYQVENDMVLGSITIRKSSTTGGMIQNAGFTIYEADGTTVAKDVKGNVLSNLKTDKNGMITVKNLLLGTYVVKETMVPKGYFVPLEATANVTLADTDLTDDKDTNQTISFMNKAISVSVGKLIEGTSDYLEGATIGIYDGNTLIERFTSGNAAYALNGKLYEIGKTYTIKEEKAPKGYAYSNAITFKINRDGTITKTSSSGKLSGTTVFMEDSSVSLQFQKMDGSMIPAAGLSGALISFMTDTGTQLAQFVSNGSVQSIDCSKVEVPVSGYAYYILREISAPAGYELAEDIKLAIDSSGKWHKVTKTGTTETVDANTISVVSMEDKQKSDLYFAKVDASDDSIRIAGADMKITDLADSSQFVEWTTTSTAKKISVGADYNSGFCLITGHNYRLQEVKAPDGYKVAKPIDFQVVTGSDGKAKMQVTNGDTSSLYADGMTIAMKDEPILLRLKKVDENSALIYGATFDLYEVGKTTPVKTNITTTKAQPVITLSGNYLKAATEYKLVETKAPAGYQKLDTPILFSIDSDGQIIRNGVVQVGNQISIANTEKVFSIQKIDGDTGYPLEGVTFTITSTDDAAFVPISWVSGAEAKLFGFCKAGFQFDKVYKLSETKTIGGYDYAADVTFYISSKDERLHNASDDSVITDNAIVVKDNKFALSVDKMVSQTTSYLEGASLQIVDENNQIVDAWVTDGTGHAVNTSKIVASKVKGEHLYTLEEISAPEFYAKAQPITFYVDKNGQVYLNDGTAVKNNKITMYDEFLGITIRKTDANGAELPGATLTITSDEDTDFEPITWVSTKTPKNMDSTLFQSDVTYILTETSAPKGYAYTKSIAFQVDADGNVYVDGAFVPDKTITMVDEALQLKLSKKIEGTDTYLKGATFGVFSAKTGEQLFTFESENGVTTVPTELLSVFKEESDDYFILRELKAPSGYELAKDVVFYFTSNGGLYVLDRDKNEFVKAEGNEITVYDAITSSTTTTSKKTGDTAPVLPIGIVFAMSLIGAMSLRIRRRKKKTV